MNDKATRGSDRNQKLAGKYVSLIRRQLAFIILSLLGGGASVK
jgi:hypothetical protein